MNACLAYMAQQPAEPALRWEDEAPPDPPTTETRREARSPTFELSVREASSEPVVRAEGEAPAEPAFQRRRAARGRARLRPSRLGKRLAGRLALPGFDPPVAEAPREPVVHPKAIPREP